MTLKQRAEEFARKFRNAYPLRDITLLDQLERSVLNTYQVAAAEWAEKGYEQGYKREARDWSKLDAMGNIINSGFAAWWKEIGGE